MRELLDHPWVKVLLLATTVAMCSFALRETASFTLPVVDAVLDVAVPVAIGFVVAYVLTPLVDLMARRSGFGRAVATAVLFLGTALVGFGSLVLVAPLLAKQSAELANQIVRGEPFADADGDGRRGPGESFTDLNGNGAHDRSVISRGVDWVQERQQRLKRLAEPPADELGLGLVAAWQQALAGPRGDLARLLGGGEPSGPPPPGAPQAWDPAWPGDAEAVAAAVAARPQLSPAVNDLGQRLAEAHRRVIEAGRRLRAGEAVPGFALPAADAAARTAAQSALAAIEAEERAGAAWAGELLEVARSPGGAVGAQAIAIGTARIEQAVRRQLDQVPDRLGAWAEATLGNLGAISGFMIDVLLVPIYAFFLILAMPAIRSGIRDTVPSRHRDSTLRIIREIERAVSAFFRGRLIICLVCACVGVAGFLLIQLFGCKVPYGILFGVLLGLVTPIPLAGIVVIAPALGLTMIQPGAGPVDAVLVLVVYGSVQAAEAVLIPVILGREVEIHPVWLIIALLLCGKVLGVLGLILAVPIAATVRILGREYLWPRLRAWAAKGVEAVQPPPDPER